MPHSPEEKKRVLARVRRMRGQVEALERALESGADCGAVLQQMVTNRLIGPTTVRTVRPPAERRVKNVGGSRTDQAKERS